MFFLFLEGGGNKQNCGSGVKVLEKIFIKLSIFYSFNSSCTLFLLPLYTLSLHLLYNIPASPCTLYRCTSCTIFLLPSCTLYRCTPCTLFLLPPVHFIVAPPVHFSCFPLYLIFHIFKKLGCTTDVHISAQGEGVIQVFLHDL